VTRKQATRASVGAGAVIAYIGAVVASNVLTAHLGLVWVAPGLVTTAGTYAAGVALLARDAVQETAGRWAVLATIAAGAALSAWLAGAHLAVASGAAFLLAEGLDMAVYTRLRERGWVRAVLWSNVAGAVLDTFVFLTLAGFPVTTTTVGGQLVGKLIWATALPVLVVITIRKVHRRAVPRYAIGR
jgi:queuosine precursor transporter